MKRIIYLFLLMGIVTNIKPNKGDPQSQGGQQSQGGPQSQGGQQSQDWPQPPAYYERFICTLTPAAEALLNAKKDAKGNFPDNARHPRGWYAGNNGTCINCNNYVKPQCLRCSSPNHKWANCTITKIYFP